MIAIKKNIKAALFWIAILFLLDKKYFVSDLEHFYTQYFSLYNKKYLTLRIDFPDI